jgi:quercetin dioxygenase-like cupin family protein
MKILKAFLATSLLVAPAAFAADFMAVAPRAKLLKEEGGIRVIEFQAKAGDKLPMHTHPLMVVYILQAGKTKFTLEDGKTRESSASTGEVLIRPPETHSQEHLTDSHAILVEITEGAGAKAPEGQKDLFAVGASHVKLLKENDKVRVYEYTAKKGDKVGMHSHPTHVVYLLKAGKTQFTLADGSKPKPGDVKTGDALINPPVAHSQEHLEDVRGILIELKK